MTINKYVIIIKPFFKLASQACSLYMLSNSPFWLLKWKSNYFIFSVLFVFFKGW